LSISQRMSGESSFVHCVCDFPNGSIPSGWVDWVNRVQERVETWQWETAPPIRVNNSIVLFEFTFGRILLLLFLTRFESYELFLLPIFHQSII